MTLTQKKQAIKAASIYLEMRRHQITEIGWSRGRHQIDIIANQAGTYEFIAVNYSSENSSIDLFNYARQIDNLKTASDIFIKETKIKASTSFFVIEVYGNAYAVMSLNQV
jgi:Holliday junction resolvase-like predicted endonuclease